MDQSALVTVGVDIGKAHLKARFARL